MKRQRIRYKLLALLVFALFGGLVVYGGYTYLTNGSRWFAYSKNSRVSSQKQSVIAGDILDRDGTVLATTDADGARVYQADEAARRAMVHLLGDTANHVANAVESFQSSYLYGFRATLWERIADLRSGEARRGDTVQLNVSAPLTTALSEALRQACDPEDPRGAAVVMNWQTGEILAAVSLPSFDPNDPQDLRGAGAPALNRAVQGVYSPGPALAPVILAALSENGESAGGTLGDMLGRVPADRLRVWAERFSFGDNFLFRDLVVLNSTYPAGTAPQELSGVRATPVHLCMTAAAVANGGLMMEPRLLLRVTGPGGAQRLSFTAAEYRWVMTPEEAARVCEGLRALTPAGLPDGVIGIAGPSGADSWFLGCMTADDMPLALCLVAEQEGDRDTALSAARQIFAWMAEREAAPAMDIAGK